MPSFWDFKPYEKWDVLNEHRHGHLIQGAMQDPETGCTKTDRKTFVLYGPDEGLLITPQSFHAKIALELYNALCAIIGKN